MSTNDSLLEVYVYENMQLLDQLDELLIAGEKNGSFASGQIDAIFRILHTIKGSSGMMGYEDLTKLSHSMEDLFAYLRDNIDQHVDHKRICDLVFAAGDFLRGEIEGLQAGVAPQRKGEALIGRIEAYFDVLKNGDAQLDLGKSAAYSEADPGKESSGKPSIEGHVIFARVFFQKDSKMENVRAFGILKSLEGHCHKIATLPEDVLSDGSDDEIVANGFSMYIDTDEALEDIEAKIREAFFIQSLGIEALQLPKQELLSLFYKDKDPVKEQDVPSHLTSDVEVHTGQKQNYMSVKLEKLDSLMDLVGEIVITESTVIKNPEISGLHLESFEKASRQLRKLTDELQDIVMSIRMIPISATFHRMERIVRDMSRKIDKEVDLVISGEDTEIDKNVIDTLVDPLMHIVRNSMDHGIEPRVERIHLGKDPVGTISLDAKNTGGDVIITICDDGKGLDREALIRKGLEKGLLNKPESEITDKEAYALIYKPGFSTNNAVTEFSGRGVGLDVALKNVEKIGGSMSIDSVPGKGMTVQIRIPLTLAIIPGMQVSVGDHTYVLPILSIKQSFKPKKNDVFMDPDRNEMILIRDEVYPVYRLHRLFGIGTSVTKFEDGILMVVEADQKTYCLFVDQLLGEQQTVIKPMPLYVSRAMGWTKGIAGCTILGDGNISLILDVNGLM